VTGDARAKALTAFGFTERQARFLALATLHAGVSLGRQYCQFAGIARGKEATSPTAAGADMGVRDEYDPLCSLPLRVDSGPDCV
jgi:hypothetical protein